MTFQEALNQYLPELADRGYSAAEVVFKGGLLRRWLSCALALYDPNVPMRLEKVSEPMFYGRERIYTRTTANRRKAVEEFLQALRREQREARQANLAVFLDGYERRFVAGRQDREKRLEAIQSFCRAVGFGVNIEAITGGIYQQLMKYLRKNGPERAPTYAQIFLVYCHEQGWMGFNPHQERRLPYEKVFDEEFLGAQTGMWTERLRAYLNHLKTERNLSDGGIDYYARKLKIFTRWLEAKGCKDPQLSVVKEFIEMKENEGVGKSTLSKYVYSIRYFFDFLVDKALMRSNPAQELQIKHRWYRELDVLTEMEVKQVIEQLEKEIYVSKGSEDIPGMMQHFRALRDLSLFHLFVFTGVRLSAVAGMKLVGIDFDKRSVRIRTKGNRGYRSTERELLLNEVVWKGFTAYLRVRNYPGQTALWISWVGAPLSISGIHRVIVARVKQAGIQKRISPHRLRATCASLYVKNGMDPFSLKTLMGHRSITTTMEHYVRLSEEELRSVWKKTNPLAGMDDE